LNGVFSTSQIAERLGITGESVRRMLRDGVLKGFKLGGSTSRRHWRIKQQDLEAFIDGNNKQASAGSKHTEANNKCSQDGARPGACHSTLK